MTKINIKDKLLLVLVILSFFILLFKELITLYLSSYVTLLPTVFVLIYFLFSFFKRNIKLKKWDYFFGAMLLVGFVSGLINNQRFIAIIYQIKSLGIYYLLYMIIRDLKIKETDIKKFVSVINIITILLVVFSVIEILFEKTILFPDEWASSIVYQDNYIRAYSLICNPNVFAFYLLFIMLFNYRFTKDKHGFKCMILYIICILGIILSISRSGLICLIILAVMFITKIIYDKMKKKKVKLSFLYVFLMLLLPVFLSNEIYTYVYYNNIDVVTNEGVNIKYENNDLQQNDSAKDNQNVFDKQEKEEETEKQGFLSRILDMVENKFLKDSMSNGRLAVINYAFKIVDDNLLIGTGFSSFLTASSFLNPNSFVNKSHLKYADNQYITILVETGIIGLILSFVFVLLFLIDLIKKKKIISVIMTFIFLFFGLFINVLEVQLISFLYFLFIGLDKEIKYD